jgi:hypothetical protein
MKVTITDRYTLKQTQEDCRSRDDLYTLLHQLAEEVYRESGRYAVDDNIFSGDLYELMYEGKKAQLIVSPSVDTLDNTLPESN